MKLNARFELVECSPIAIDNSKYGENFKIKSKTRSEDTKEKKRIGADSRRVGRNGKNQQNSYGTY